MLDFFSSLICLSVLVLVPHVYLSCCSEPGDCFPTPLGSIVRVYAVVELTSNFRLPACLVNHGISCPVKLNKVCIGSSCLCIPCVPILLSVVVTAVFTGGTPRVGFITWIDHLLPPRGCINRMLESGDRAGFANKMLQYGPLGTF